MGEELTREEIMALVKSGELTPADLKILSPTEQGMAREAFLESKKLLSTEQLAGMVMGMGGAGGKIPSLPSIPVPAAATVGKIAVDQAPRIGGAAGAAIGSTIGHPFIGRALGAGLGDKIKRLFGGGSSEGRGRAPKAPSSPPAEFTGSKVAGAMDGQTIKPSMPTKGSVSVPVKPKPPAPTGTGVPSGKVMDTGAGPSGFSMFPSRSAGSPPPTAPSFTMSLPKSPGGQISLTPPAKDFAGTAERVLERGVQNNFTPGKRVTFEKPAIPESGLKIPTGSDPKAYAQWEELINRVAAPELPMDLLLQSLQASLEKDDAARSRKPKPTTRRRPR